MDRHKTHPGKWARLRGGRSRTPAPLRRGRRESGRSLARKRAGAGRRLQQGPAPAWSRAVRAAVHRTQRGVGAITRRQHDVVCGLVEGCRGRGARVSHPPLSAQEAGSPGSDTPRRRSLRTGDVPSRVSLSFRHRTRRQAQTGRSRGFRRRHRGRPAPLALGRPRRWWMPWLAHRQVVRVPRVRVDQHAAGKPGLATCPALGVAARSPGAARPVMANAVARPAA